MLGLPLLFGPRGLPVSGHRLAASAAGQAVHALALAPDDPSALLKAALTQLLWGERETLSACGLVSMSDRTPEHLDAPRQV